MQKWSVLDAWAFVDKCVMVLFSASSESMEMPAACKVPSAPRRIECEWRRVFFPLFSEHVFGLIYDDPIPNLKLLLKNQNYGSGF